MNPYQNHDNPYDAPAQPIDTPPVWQPPYGHPPKPPKPKTGLRIAALFCACLLVSGLAGFGGGYLAVSLQGNQMAAAAVPPPNGTSNTAPAVGQTAATGTMSVSQVVAAVSDTVVAINTEIKTTSNFFMQPVTGQSAGSGVIIAEDGHILTNNHVIEGATSISVTLKNGERYDATLIGVDSETDLAVIKIEATGLRAAPLGSSGGLMVGDEAIAIGNPLGELGGTVTNGIVSAVNREVTIEERSMTLLQTNAAINPGNSGGGLFNNRGELIGIVVAKSAGAGVEGLGFAIPIDTAKGVADDLIANGYVTGRGELGVSIIEVSDSRTALYYRVPQNGVYLAGVNSGSAAAHAGLKIGDGVLAVNDVEITTANALQAEIAKHKAGDSIELKILRDGAQKTVRVTLGEKVPEEIRQKAAAL